MAIKRFGVFFSACGALQPDGNGQPLPDGKEVRRLERLGFHEVWLGESHATCGRMSVSADLAVASIAAATTSIRVGTGFVELGVDHPVAIAQRAAHLDRLLGGRLILGVRPAGTAATVRAGTRDLVEDSLGIIGRLFRSAEPVSCSNGRWDLHRVTLDPSPVQRNGPEIVIASSAGADTGVLAGRYGLGLLSTDTSTTTGFGALPNQWHTVESNSRLWPTLAVRSGWRIPGLMHVAESMVQAFRDVERDLPRWCRLAGESGVIPPMAAGDEPSARECIEFVNDSGMGCIGTPAMAVNFLDRLSDASAGGFGVFLLAAHGWADAEATRRHYELFARQVATPFARRAATAIGDDSLLAARLQVMFDNDQAPQRGGELVGV